MSSLKIKTKQLCEFDPLAMFCPWLLLDHSPAHSIPIRLLPFDCCCLKPRKGQMALQSWHRTLPQCVVLGWSCGSCSDVGYGFPEFTRYIQHPLSLPAAAPPPHSSWGMPCLTTFSTTTCLLLVSELCRTVAKDGTAQPLVTNY